MDAQLPAVVVAVARSELFSRESNDEEAGPNEDWEHRRAEPSRLTHPLPSLTHSRPSLPDYRDYWLLIMIVSEHVEYTRETCREGTNQKFGGNFRIHRKGICQGRELQLKEKGDVRKSPYPPSDSLGPIRNEIRGL